MDRTPYLGDVAVVVHPGKKEMGTPLADTPTRPVTRHGGMRDLHESSFSLSGKGGAWAGRGGAQGLEGLLVFLPPPPGRALGLLTDTQTWGGLALGSLPRGTPRVPHRGVPQRCPRLCGSQPRPWAAPRGPVILFSLCLSLTLPHHPHFFPVFIFKKKTGTVSYI